MWRLFRRAFLFQILGSFLAAPLLTQAEVPQKIVSLSPSISEWVAEILGEKESLRRLVGVSEYSNYPVYLSSIPTVGPYPQINIERVAALHPDLVIASRENNLSEQIEKLKRLHLRVEVLPAESFLHLEDWLHTLGSLLQEPKKTHLAMERWNQGIAELKKRPVLKEAKRMMIEVQHEPLIVVGGNSFLNDAFLSIGYRNVFSDLGQSYPKVSKEAVLKENPDFIFVFEMNGAHTETLRSEKDWAKFSSLKAVQKKQILQISGDDFARCSMRLLKGLKQL